MREHRYFVYIVASRSRTLYIGVTSMLERRMQQHKEGIFEGFSRQYQCNRLVYYESYGQVSRAAREKQLKRWSRQKKLTLIEQHNPAWYDLSSDWGKPIPLWREPHATPNPTAGLSTPAQSASGRDDTEWVGLK